DDGESCVRAILEDVYSPYFDVFVFTDDWVRVLEQRKVDKQSANNRIRFVSLRKAEAFRGVTLLGANVEESMLYHWLSRFHGVDFVEHTGISNRLRFKTYPEELADRIKVSYVMKGRGYSKWLRDRKDGDSGKTVGEEIDDAIAQEVGDSEFLLVAN